MEECHLVSAPGSLLHIVSDDADDHVLLQLVDQILDFMHADRVERAGRLIE
jgi:hypothetical protein